jgi:PAS domain S-box-containing protein
LASARVTVDLSEGALLRTLVDTLPSMVAYWDASVRCRFANRAYERWFGVSPESIIGKHIRELLGPLYELNLPHIEGALRGEPQEFERDIPNPAGGPPRHSIASYIPNIVGDAVQGFFMLVTDISEVKRTQLALREAEERFRLTLDGAPIGMAIVAPDGRFLRVNRALCDIVGYTEDDLTGLTFQAITHPDDLDADLALTGRLTRGEIPRYNLAKRYIRKGGKVVDVMLSGSVLRRSDGTPIHFIAQIEDITEQKRAQEAVRQSQERFELALDGGDLGSWDWNIESGEVIFNARWAEMRGFRPEEIKPHVDSWSSGVHPDDRERVRRALTDYFEGRSSEYDSEHRVRTKSGAWIWILDRGKVFERDRAGNPTRMVGTELDVTERKRLADEQRFLAEVGPVLAGTLDYEEILSAIADLAVRDLADLCIVDVVEDDRVVRLRVASRDPAKAWISEALTRVQLDRSRPYLLRSVLETRRSVLLQRPTAEELASLSQSEEHLRALRGADIGSMVAVPLLAHGKVLGAIAFVASTGSRVYGTADVRLAEELAHRAALSIENARLYRAARRATQARDDVLGIVAHDLRNPLHTILLEAAILRRNRTETEQGRTAGQNIERSAKRMNRLIQDLLDVTRIEAGRLSVALSPVPSRDVLLDALAAHRALAADRSLELRLDAPSDLPEVCADRHRVLQIFENLIGNAIKFSQPGGCVSMGASAREGEVLFWVSDTGPGIAAEDVPRVFERFWQSKPGQRRGAGLGLPIVKGIVEAHRGRIWVESTPGKGSCFFFTIRAAQPEVGACTSSAWSH